MLYIESLCEVFEVAGSVPLSRLYEKATSEVNYLKGILSTLLCKNHCLPMLSFTVRMRCVSVLLMVRRFTSFFNVVFEFNKVK